MEKMIVIFPKNKKEALEVVGVLNAEWESALQTENKRERCKKLRRIIKAAQMMRKEALDRAKKVDEGSIIPINWQMRQVANLFALWLRQHGMPA